MPEPFSTGTFLATTAASWLGKKGLDWSAKRMWASLSQKDFKQHLDKAWKNDSTLRAACDPPPTFDHERLSPARWYNILEFVLTGNEIGLGEFLFSEQLINLPQWNATTPQPFQVVGRCAAEVTLQVVCRTIATDATMRGEFDVFAAQHHTANFGQVLAELYQLQHQNETVSNQVDRLHNAITTATADHTELLTQLLSHTEDQRDNKERIIDLTRENVDLGQQLIDLLDEKGLSAWNDIQDELKRENFSLACAKGEALREWLANQGKNATPTIQGRAHLLLAHLALLSPNGPLPDAEGVDRAVKLSHKAIAIFGTEIGHAEESLLARFRAKIHAIRGQHDTALAEIERFGDSHSTLTKLAILLDADRLDEAYAIVESRQFESEWAAEAIIVSLRTAHPSRAIDVLNWSLTDTDENTVDRCRLAFARTSFISAHRTSTKSHDDTNAVDLTGPERKTIQDAFDSLSPIILRVQSRGRPVTGVESDCVAVAYACMRRLGNVDQARSIIGLLEHRDPIHEEYVRAVFRRDVTCNDSLVERVRNNYPDDCEMQLLATDIEWNNGQNVQDTTAKIHSLFTRFTSNKDRRKLAEFAFEIATSKDALDNKVRDILENICSSDARAHQYLQIYYLLHDGKLDDASRLLATADPADIVVMQLVSELNAKQGNQRESARMLAEVGRKMPEPYFLRKAAFLSRKIGDRLTAIQLLEESLLLDPDHKQALGDLAMLRVAVGDYLRAAELFEKLSHGDPSGFECKLNQARCLAQAGDTEIALEILSKLETLSDLPSQVSLTKAEILRDTDRPREALEALKLKKDSNWHDPVFVLTYMDVAYHANSDSEANDAFQRLIALRAEHPLARQLLQPHSMDDVLNFMERASKTLRKLSDELLTGRIPWLVLERFSNNPPYWAWFVRTQALAWFSEESVNSASFSVYATNGYSVLVDDDGSRKVLPIAASPRNQHVVADLSSLITLDRLKLLEIFIDYAGKVFIPRSYLGTVLTDGAKLLPHQPSQTNERKVIFDAVRSGQLKVLEDNSTEGFQILDDFVEDKASSFSTADLNSVLENALSDVESNDHYLKIDEPIVATLATLQHMVCKRAFERAVSRSNLFLSKSDFQRIKDSIANETARREVRDWHIQLWERLRTDPGVVFELVADDGKVNAEEDEDVDEGPADRILAFEAFTLAQQLDLPLLVDDRLFQAARLNERPEQHYAAFGAGQVAEALFTAGLITSRTASESLLQLIDWRYRFVILSPTRLKAIYEEKGLSALESVASYVHASMRDRGLFSGFENADFSVPMAFRLYQDWERNITRFIAALWIDNSVSTNDAERVTEWAITEFLPSLPINLESMAPRLATFAPSFVIMQLLFELVATQNYSRAHAALLCVARHLGLTYSEYMRLAGEVIAGYERN